MVIVNTKLTEAFLIMEQELMAFLKCQEPLPTLHLYIFSSDIFIALATRFLEKECLPFC